MGGFTIIEADPEFYRLYLPGIGMDAFKTSARVMLIALFRRAADVR